MYIYIYIYTSLSLSIYIYIDRYVNTSINTSRPGSRAAGRPGSRAAGRGVGQAGRLGAEAQGDMDARHARAACTQLPSQVFRHGYFSSGSGWLWQR